MADPIEKKFEGYEIDVPYAFTFAPDDRYQRFRTKDRWYRCYRDTREMFISIAEALEFEDEEGNTSQGFDYELYQEMSEPKNIKDGKAGRIHYHGIIIIKNYQAWRSLLSYWMSSLTCNGIIDMDTIDDMNTWYKYCTKQQHKSNFHSITNRTPSIMKSLCDDTGKKKNNGKKERGA